MALVFTDNNKFVPYSAFKENISAVSLFLDLGTVGSFSTLSMYFKEFLNPNSDFGRFFWRTWAVKNGGIKPFKDYRTNFKYKLMKQMLDSIKKKANSHHIPYRPRLTCLKCNLDCKPDIWISGYFHDSYEEYCNCETVNCDSIMKIMKDDIDSFTHALQRKKKMLLIQLSQLDDKMEKLEEKKDGINQLLHLEKMKSAFQNVEKNDKYKKTRFQAKEALRDLDKYNAKTCRFRENMNYKSR
jgi:hypothetical protein